MKARTIGYILLIISLIMIVSGGVSSFLIGLKADKDLTYRMMDDVSTEFESFSTFTTLFEEERDNLYVNVLSNASYDTMYANDANIKMQLSNYEGLVDELGRKVVVLDKLCDDVYYPDGQVNNKCGNYKSIYEQVVNYFIGDINVYNTNVDKYNQYQLGTGSTLAINKYETTKDYIDYNNDKKFDGKEE